MRRWLRRVGLQARLTLMLGLAVLLTIALAGYLTRRAVLEPFTREVVRAHLNQVVYVAQEIEGGADPVQLGERLGLELRVMTRPPRLIRRALRGAPGPCRLEPFFPGRTVVACRGRRGGVAVRLAAGWLLARRNLDPHAPKQRALVVLGGVGASVLLIAILLAAWVTRPVRASVAAMDQMAKGDLRHRLPEKSGGEVGEVARAFNRMADRVSALLEAERSLMASISHELRTPLARLRLEIELLRDHEVPERRLEAMESDVAEIDRLIGEVLESSRLSIGDRDLQRAPVDLRELVEEALGQVDLSGHEVAIDGVSGVVEADPARMRRVVRNLLENAGKYAPADSCLQVRLEPSAITVADRGPGVPEYELPRLFEPFYRGTRGKDSGATGYGLGLMIAKQIVELHDGTITVRNRDGGGLEVRVELSRAPRRASESPPARA